MSNRTEFEPLTTESLDYQTLLKYVVFLKAKPAVRGVWLGDAKAVAGAAATSKSRRSLNSVGASMRSIQGFTNWLFHDGRLATDPFHRKYRRNKQHPLLPREETPKKGATIADIEALERGCKGNNPLDFRDQAIVAVLKTTVARNGAVRNLRVDDVDFNHNTILFRDDKGHRSHEVALLPEAKAALVRYLRRGRPKLLPRYPVRGLEDIPLGEDEGYLFVAKDNGTGKRGGPLSQGSLAQVINRRYKAGGGTIQSFRSHRIRHGTATILANNGMPLAELSRQMDHASVSTTAIYAPQSAETIGRHLGAAMGRAGLTKNSRR